MSTEKTTDTARSSVSSLILYEDDELLILNKPTAISIAPEAINNTSLAILSEEYCGHPLKLVHGLDKACTGFVIFAKDKHTCIKLFKQFKDEVLIKKYLAVVNKAKKLPPKLRLEDKLFYDRKRNKTYVRSWLEDGGKLAKLDYELLDVIRRYSLLEVKTYTSEEDQIRVQLSHLGYPVKGDTKYGYKGSNKDKSIQLHAWKLSFSHPKSKEKIRLCAPPPQVGVWKYFDI